MQWTLLTKFYILLLKFRKTLGKSFYFALSHFLSFLSKIRILYLHRTFHSWIRYRIICCFLISTFYSYSNSMCSKLNLSFYTCGQKDAVDENERNSFACEFDRSVQLEDFRRKLGTDWYRSLYILAFLPAEGKFSLSIQL